MKSLILVIALLAITACDKKSTDGTYARARAESEAGKDINNSNLAEKAKRMEDDLKRRYRFFKGVSHDYSGWFKINGNSYQMKIGMAPTLHVVETDRVRTLEEIQDDLNNLFLSAQIVIWDKDGTIGAAGCVFEKVRPDIMNGMIQLVSSECPNRYTIYLSTPGTSQKDRPEFSSILAKAVLEGNQKEVQDLYVDVSSRFNPQGYGVEVKKRRSR